MIIIVTGTPGTGKTELAKKIATISKAKYVDVNSLIKKHNLVEMYDKKRKCKVVHSKKLATMLNKFVKDSKKDLVIDSHMAHVIDAKMVDACIITKCNLRQLEKRLRKRKYSQQKISDNLEAEIMEICETEAFDNGHTPIVVNTDKVVTIKKIKEFIR